jgi:hypothetical protein
MNEHFKKHLEASYTRAFEECARTGHRVGDLDAIFNSIAMATFAELIVKECVGVVEGGHFLHKDAPDARFAQECSSAIKRHFGVE